MADIAKLDRFGQLASALGVEPMVNPPKLGEQQEGIVIYLNDGRVFDLLDILIEVLTRLEDYQRRPHGLAVR